MSARQPLQVDIAGSGPAIVLIHGVGGSPESDYPFIDKLADRFTVVAAALPGIGSSELGTEPLTVDRVAERLIAALDQNGIGACTLIGFSLGSTVVVRAAEMLGDRASGVILRLRPDARQVWLPSGHALGTEAPDGWFTAITKFVADVQATPAWESADDMTSISPASREAP